MTDRNGIEIDYCPGMPRCLAFDRVAELDKIIESVNSNDTPHSIYISWQVLGRDTNIKPGKSTPGELDF